MGVKSPRESLLPARVDDEAPTWANRMEEPEALTSSGDKTCPVKVHEETELVLQKAFTPLKNPDCRAVCGAGHASDHGPKAG